MTGWTIALLISSIALFLLAIRLSAFFSGSETGFYRLSRIRLSIASQNGDSIAKRLLWFSGMPERFVATALVGNNIANYLATFAIGLMAVAFLPNNSGLAEILLTLALAPLIFIWGELIPKTVYYRAPMRFLGKHSRALTAWYYALRPISAPLTVIAKLVERFGNSEKQPLELLLGRNRLIHVLNEGHREGLLGNVQRRLAESVMELSGQPVDASMVPSVRVLSVPKDTSVTETLDLSKLYSLSHILVHEGDANDWIGYVCIGDLRGETIEEAIQPIIRIPTGLGKLDAIQRMRKQRAFFAVVARENEPIGVVTERGLLAPLFRPRQVSEIP
ncbi:MAG: CNNM domain-containing protein [Planctomycetaceae bacterium]